MKLAVCQTLSCLWIVLLAATHASPIDSMVSNDYQSAQFASQRNKLMQLVSLIAKSRQLSADEPNVFAG